MAAVAPPLNIVINNQTYGPIQNPRADLSALDQVIESNKTSSISFRILQLMERVCKAVAMVWENVASFFNGLAAKLLIAWGMLSIPRLPDVTKKACEAITTWGTVEGPEGYALRGHVKRVHDLADCGATWLYVGSMVFDSMPLKNAGDVFNFGSDVTDLSMAAEDYGMAGKHLEFIETNHATNVALKDRFAETKKEALLRVVKAIASVVSGALGLLVLFFGGPILPAAILLAISLTSTIFALMAHFFKETATYEKVKFFEWLQRPDANGLRVN